ncbi:J domain-containing protein [Acidithiobacillus thiooxidans]|uniref:J domain-containing protein n=1 Tax=Acidithiobacillus thiooxidans TaxID=930 RepID=UPI001C071389|nr:J domain-containing protein [Acidithiobacillus thiooxidans]MBU2838312.1 J domain-containing protein [Acidithiobacillus thiooxidans]
MADAQQRAVTDMLPAQQRYLALQIELLKHLDGSSQTIKFGKVAQETLSEVIVHLAEVLVMECPDDPIIREIHQRHGGEDLMDEDTLRAVLEEGMNGRSDDAGEGEERPAGPESFTEFMERRIKERLAEQVEGLRREAEALGGAPGSVHETPERPRTAAQKARDTQQAAQAANIRQALQMIYRKLVSLVHPDRETDPDRREQKTTLMQRANQAYAGKDLLQLLALQQELGQIEPETLQALEGDHLKTYNQALQQHLAGLKARIQEFQQRAAAVRGVSLFFMGSPKGFVRDFEDTLREMRLSVAGVQQEMEALQEPKALKAWLQRQRQAIRRQQQMDRDTEMFWGADEDY